MLPMSWTLYRLCCVLRAALCCWLLGDCIVYGSAVSKSDLYKFHTQLFLDGALLLLDPHAIAESLDLESLVSTRSHALVSAETVVPSWCGGCPLCASAAAASRVLFVACPCGCT